MYAKKKYLKVGGWMENNDLFIRLSSAKKNRFTYNRIWKIKRETKANTVNQCNAANAVQYMTIDFVTLHSDSSTPLTPIAKVSAKQTHNYLFYSTNKGWN